MYLRGLYLFDELGIREPRTSVRKKVPRFFMPISQNFGKISHLWDLGKRKNKIEEMKKSKIILLSMAIAILFASCIYNREYITDYGKKTTIVRENFPEIYDLYKQGKVIIESVYIDMDTNRYHVEYRYR